MIKIHSSPSLLHYKDTIFNKRENSNDDENDNDDSEETDNPDDVEDDKGDQVDNSTDGGDES